MTQEQAAQALGMSKGGYIKIEDSDRRLTTERIAKAAELFSVHEAEIFTDLPRGSRNAPLIETEPPSALIPASRSFTAFAPIRGDVQAGAWLEAEAFDDDLGEAISAPRDPDFPHARQVAFRVRGDSMNSAQPTAVKDGDFAICVMFEDLGLDLRNGMKVVVERSRDGGHTRERSLKEALVFDDRIEFWPRSSDPRFKPIVVKRDLTADDGTVVRVLALLRFSFNNQPVPIV